MGVEGAVISESAEFLGSGDGARVESGAPFVDDSGNSFPWLAKSRWKNITGLWQKKFTFSLPPCWPPLFEGGRLAPSTRV